MDKANNSLSASKPERVARNAAIIFSGKILHLILGLGVSVLIARAFGAGAEMDAFMIANLLPALGGDIIFSVAFLLLIPAFLAEKSRSGEKSAWRLFSGFFNLSFLILLGGFLALYAFAPLIIRIVAPGFAPATRILAGRLLRFLSPLIIFCGISGMLSSLLQAYRRFTWPALVGPIIQLATIVTILLGQKRLGIYAYALGIIAGYAISVIVQGLAAKSGTGEGGGYRFSFSHPALKTLLIALPPLLLARILDQGNLVVNRLIASTMAVGSVSALGYALRILNLPIMVSASISMAIFPRISESAGRRDYSQLSEELARYVSVLIFLGVPIMVIFLTFNQPIVKILFERGKFTSDFTRLTSRILFFYSLGIVFTSINSLIGNAFWALKLMKVRLLLESAAVAFCVILNLTLGYLMGPAGLALATSLEFLFLMAAGILYLSRKKILKKSFWEWVIPSIRKILISALIMFGGLCIGRRFLFSDRAAGLWGQFFQLLSVSFFGFLIYFSSSYLFKIKEARELTRSIKSKFG